MKPSLDISALQQAHAIVASFFESFGGDFVSIRGDPYTGGVTFDYADDASVELSPFQVEILEKAAEMARKAGLLSQGAEALSVHQNLVIVSEITKFGEANDIMIYADLRSGSEALAEPETPRSLDQLDFDYLINLQRNGFEVRHRRLGVFIARFGRPIQLDYQSMIPVSEMQSRSASLTRFVKSLDEDAEAVIELHGDSKTGIRTAALCTLDTCPMTGEQIKAVQECHILQ